MQKNSKVKQDDCKPDQIDAIDQMGPLDLIARCVDMCELQIQTGIVHLDSLFFKGCNTSGAS